MWAAERTILQDGRVEKSALLRDGVVATFADVVSAWRGDEAFRAFFIAQLAATPFPAFFWEMPPIRRAALARRYEYVTVRSDALANFAADSHTFAHLLKRAEGSVSIFRNLGNDALLVAPRQIGTAESYTHLASFLHGAPESQQHELFRSLAEAIVQELERTRANIWISTSGLGVAWLHIRLDAVPKYYQYTPYADPA